MLSDPLNFSVHPRQVLHIQGHNGAGKTTLMMILAGLLPAPSVSALSWAGLKPIEWPVLYIGHKIALNAMLTVKQNLVFIQSLNSMSSVDLDIALEAVGLRGFEDVSVAQLSSGQKRRVGLARLWLTTNPDELWLLDEPLTSLDQKMADQLCQQISKHADQGGRVILTSHQALTIPCEILDLAEYPVSESIFDGSMSSSQDSA